MTWGSDSFVFNSGDNDTKGHTEKSGDWIIIHQMSSPILPSIPQGDNARNQSELPFGWEVGANRPVDDPDPGTYDLFF